MTCTQEELELQDKFENYYKLSQESAVLSIESRVCGCRYGASGWTTRNQADDLVASLKLQIGARLLGLVQAGPPFILRKKVGARLCWWILRKPD